MIPTLLGAFFFQTLDVCSENKSQGLGIAQTEEPLPSMCKAVGYSKSTELGAVYRTRAPVVLGQKNFSAWRCNGVMTAT